MEKDISHPSEPMSVAEIIMNHYYESAQQYAYIKGLTVISTMALAVNIASDVLSDEIPYGTPPTFVLLLGTIFSAVGYRISANNLAKEKAVLENIANSAILDFPEPTNGSPTGISGIIYNRALPKLYPKK